MQAIKLNMQARVIQKNKSHTKEQKAGRGSCDPVMVNGTDYRARKTD